MTNRDIMATPTPAHTGPHNHSITAHTAPHPARWKALGVLASAVSLIVIDGTIVNVALPTMMDSLHLSLTQAQWTTTLYSLIFAALLISTGRLGDRIGRHITLTIGIVVFIVGSMLAALAPGAALLLIARAIQGVGGAFVLPSTLSIVNATFTGRERATAFGIWGATISGAAAIGPLLGGWLTSSCSWRLVFLINLPLGALLLAGNALWVRPCAAHTPRATHMIADAASSPDLYGFLLSSLGMGAIVFGLIEGQNLGWVTPKQETWASSWPLSPVLPALILGLGAIGAFVALESRRRRSGRDVLIDLTLFTHRSFSWGNLAALVVAMGEFGLLFVLPLYLQNVRGMSAIEAGWMLAAMAAGALISGALAAPLAHLTTAATVACLGLVLETLGVAVLAFVLTADSPLWHVIVPLVVYGLGLGLASAQLTGTILVDVPAQQSGQGSATQSTVRQLGSALGTAVIASILAWGVSGASISGLDTAELSGPSSHMSLPSTQVRALEKAVAPSAGRVIQQVRHGQGQAAQIPAPAREHIAEALADSFTKGARLPLWAGAGFLALGVVATTQLPRRRAS